LPGPEKLHDPFVRANHALGGGKGAINIMGSGDNHGR
jgi:hypothetical protein